ncbi:MAG: zinc-binding alcohol dehydrogenase family protein [Akkermansiaceae bacterium]
MKAFGALNSSIQSICEFKSIDPSPAPDEILVRVKAVSVNPVDTKVRKLIGPDDLPTPRILGFDAAGIVEHVGADVSTFETGDEVFYSGDVTKAGSNAELQVVQAAVVAKKPKTFSWAEAAALPLVALTGWELLFERMVAKDLPQGSSILIINGSGGVGSAIIPLAKSIGLTVVTTASREASIQWCLDLGADHVINHRKNLKDQSVSLGFPEFPLIANLYDTELYWDATSELLAPLGTLGLIVETQNPVDIGNPLRLKSPRIVWEYMPARTRFQTDDLHHQGEILTTIANWCDEGNFPKINQVEPRELSVENLKAVHHEMESATSIGKATLELH